MPSDDKTIYNDELMMSMQTTENVQVFQHRNFAAQPVFLGLEPKKNVRGVGIHVPWSIRLRPSGEGTSGEGTLRERFLCSNHVPRIQIPTHRTLEREKCVLLQLPRPFLASYPED